MEHACELRVAEECFSFDVVHDVMDGFVFYGEFFFEGVEEVFQFVH